MKLLPGHFAIAAFTLIIVSLLLPWAESKSIFNTVSTRGIETPDGIFFMLFSVIGICFAYSSTQYRFMAILNIILAAISSYFTISYIIDIAGLDLGSNYVIAQVGSGLYIAAMSSIFAFLVSIITLFYKEKENSKTQE